MWIDNSNLGLSRIWRTFPLFIHGFLFISDNWGGIVVYCGGGGGGINGGGNREEEGERVVVVKGGWGKGCHVMFAKEIVRKWWERDCAELGSDLLWWWWLGWREKINLYNIRIMWVCFCYNVERPYLYLYTYNLWGPEERKRDITI